MQPELRDTFRLIAHQRACAALRTDPALISEPRRVLAGWLAQRAENDPVTALLHNWSKLLAVNQNDPKALESLFLLFCEESPAGQQLRESSPLVFVLSRKEIQEVKEKVKQMARETETCNP